MSDLRIATRGSALALWQARHVRDRLASVCGLAAEIVVVRTTGDRVLDVPLSRIGERGLFTKEVDDAILEGRADLAVHSLKDLPTTLAHGLEIAAILERADPADVLVTRAPSTDLASLPTGARVGTSSLRRRAQLRAARPDLDIVDLRGNVDTRIARVAAGDVDATVLARAGLVRLNIEPEGATALRAPEWLPAVGQGALAVVVAHGQGRDAARLDHGPTRLAVTAERALLRRLEGGCQVPIGALAKADGQDVDLTAGVFSIDGASSVRNRVRGRDPESLGVALAETLLQSGADEILQAIRHDASAPRLSAP